jgi:hypothetical protein
LTPAGSGCEISLWIQTIAGLYLIIGLVEQGLELPKIHWIEV